MTQTPNVTVEEIEVCADELDVARAAQTYREHGCLVVRGLMKPYLAAMQRDIEASAQQALSLLDEAQKIKEGWLTADGTLWLPAPENFHRQQQIMVLGMRYNTSGALVQSAMDSRLLDIVEGIVGPDIELFMDGQCLYKEPVGGHPKHLHQDAAYFEHRYQGPLAVLNYAVDTDLQNGALYVVPGSHQLGMLPHVDTFSHLGLDADEWPWERALPVCGQAGDSIFFHVKTIHGSQENHSDKPRPVFIHRYRRPDDYVVVGATNAEDRAEAQQRVAQANSKAQHGWMLRGFRPHESNEN